MLVAFAFLLHGAKESAIKIHKANRCEYYHYLFLQLCESPVRLYVLLSAFPAADTEAKDELKGGIRVCLKRTLYCDGGVGKEVWSASS